LAPKLPFPKVVVTGTRWAPHEDIYHFVLTRTWTQFFLLIGGGYTLINAAFAFFYWLAPGAIEGVANYEDAFFFSVQTLATIGYGKMVPVSRIGHLLVTLESIVGVLGIALTTGVTFAKFARPTARVRFATKICAHDRDGVPHLVFRLANRRQNNIVEAQLRVILLIEVVTNEGHAIRSPIDLQLVRDRNASFSLSWLVRHRIDEDSPFHGEDAIERLSKQKMEMFLSLSGLDDTMGQTVNARWRYTLDDIVWGGRFEDILHVDENGTRHLNYEKFDHILPAKLSGAVPRVCKAPETFRT
jgi:inward rectifier potassium channel